MTITINIEEALILANMKNELTDAELDQSLSGNLTPAAVACIIKDYLRGYLTDADVMPYLMLSQASESVN
jgi:hypothetical protein